MWSKEENDQLKENILEYCKVCIAEIYSASRVPFPIFLGRSKDTMLAG